MASALSAAMFIQNSSSLLRTDVISPRPTTFWVSLSGDTHIFIQPVPQVEVNLNYFPSRLSYPSPELDHKNEVTEVSPTALSPALEATAAWQRKHGHSAVEKQHNDSSPL